jgi:hypothetical protein
MSLPLLFDALGWLQASVAGRIFFWIGPMSLPVLIMNEPFRFIDHYLWFKDVTYSPGWWVYIVAVYVPGTLITASLLSRLLGLTPPEHVLQLFRRSVRAPATAPRERNGAVEAQAR